MSFHKGKGSLFIYDFDEALDEEGLRYLDTMKDDVELLGIGELNLGLYNRTVICNPAYEVYLFAPINKTKS